MDRAAEKAVQRCIDSACGATYGLRERIYVCPRCGGTLEIDCHLVASGGATALRKRWAARAASRDPRDVSGVWRYREMLPFDEPIPFVTLFEGNTPLYHGPRSAHYCGLDDLRLKHQGCNPTGSFKDTGMSAAITQAVVVGARTAVCASTGNTSASLAAYAGRAGLQAAVLLPRGQIYGGKTCAEPGLRRVGLRDRRKFRRLHASDSGAGRRSLDLRGELDQPVSHRGTKDRSLRDDGAVPVAGSGPRGGARREHGQQHGARQRLSGAARAPDDRPSAETERDSGRRRGARSRDFSRHSI